MLCKLSKDLDCANVATSFSIAKPTANNPSVFVYRYLLLIETTTLMRLLPSFRRDLDRNY